MHAFHDSVPCVHSKRILVPNMCVCHVGTRFLDFYCVMYLMYVMYVCVMYVMYVMYVYDFSLDFSISKAWAHMLQMLFFHWISHVEAMM